MSDSGAAVVQGDTRERVEPDEHCNGQTSDGGLCQQRSGARTTHVGQGRCWLHGGRNVIKHGRYSKINRPRLRGLIEEFAGDPDPLDTLDDIAAARAIFADFVERYDEWKAALIAWYESAQYMRRPLPPDLVHAFGNVIDEWEQQLKATVDEPTERQMDDIDRARKFVTMLRGNGAVGRPTHVLDISDAHRMLGEIARMVERVHKARAINAISRPELNRVMQQMWRSVELRVSDDTLKSAIREDWMTIAL